jgi:hypothetical protein
MKKPFLLIFTLTFMIAACLPSVNVETDVPPIEMEPPPEQTERPCDDTSVEISVSPSSGGKGIVISVSSLQPGETIKASFYQQVGDEETLLTVRPIRPADDQGKFVWFESQLESGAWKARVESLAGVTCQTITVP